MYSAVNAVINLGSGMQPLNAITAETPAVVGDLCDNLTLLNEDASDTVNVLVATEKMAGQLFNLAAATQNDIRQQIGEQVYACNSRRYCEPFLNQQNLSQSSATLDFDIGSAYLPVSAETQIVPTSIVVPMRMSISRTATTRRRLPKRRRLALTRCLTPPCWNRETPSGCSFIRRNKEPTGLHVVRNFVELAGR